MPMVGCVIVLWRRSCKTRTRPDNDMKSPVRQVAQVARWLINASRRMLNVAYVAIPGPKFLPEFLSAPNVCTLSLKASSTA